MGSYRVAVSKSPAGPWREVMRIPADDADNMAAWPAKGRWNRWAELHCEVMGAAWKAAGWEIRLSRHST